MTQNIPKIIPPTVGRKVHFYAQGSSFTKLNAAGELVAVKPHDLGGPMDAAVVYVWHDRMVNLVFSDHYGNRFTATSVTLLQEGDKPPLSAYCEWMPFQKGLAAKADAGPVVAISSEQRFWLERQLVMGAAATLAQAPYDAENIANGIKTLLDTLHPVSIDPPLVLPVVEQPVAAH